MSQISTSLLTTYAQETGRICPYVVRPSGNYPTIQSPINAVKTQFRLMSFIYSLELFIQKI